MAKIVELRKLSKEFYKAYPRNEFPEMEAKLGRPYVVLLVEINTGLHMVAGHDAFSDIIFLP
ncbi:MAG: hypothetical protein SOW65_04060 [Candidatus Enterosoma sp.]|nr:hypothetical protein [bacterium]MDD7707253.1 hypothetical protein [bacterium]MDY3080954.1 hypothetical protein [Candidatus Enterosoma sp.]MDY3211002.1 hypothetical protein [Candidatus Enterosoma sp.]